MNTNWEERFDELFMMPHEFTPVAHEPIYDIERRKVELKDFVRSLLKEQLEEKRAKVLELTNLEPPFHDIVERSEVLSLLSDKS